MLSVPTIGQMLAVIGVALLAVIVVITGLSLLRDWLTRRTAAAVNNTAALSDRPTSPAPSLPAQHITAQPVHAAQHQHAA